MPLPVSRPGPLTTPGREPDRRPAVRSLRLLVIANPHASTTTGALLHEVVGILATRHRVDPVLTTHRGHAIELCRTAVGERYDAVVVLGGDGTINEAANGVAGSGTALAPLPGGATNVYTRMLGIPRDVLQAAEQLADWRDLRERSVDLGRINDRWFTFAAGVGLDASVVERVDRHPRRKARWGPWFFAGVGLSVFLGRYVRGAPRLEVHAAGRHLPAVSVLMQNGKHYTYFGERPITLVRDAGLQSGDLSGVALTRADGRDLIPVLWRALSGRRQVIEHPGVEPLRVDAGMLVRSVDGRPAPIHVDGDHVGAVLEARLTLAPAALRVLGGSDRGQTPPGVIR
jgi:diacylglycerol kinase family enzyme